MSTTAHTSLTLENAAFPGAAGSALRDPEPPIRYRLLRRLGDGFAGWRDRRCVTVGEDGALRSPWLQRLGFECSTALEAERRSTHAALAVLEAGISDARQTIAQATAHTEESRSTRSRLESSEVSDAPVTASDHTDDPAARRARRQRERAARLGDLAAQESAWEATIDGAHATIQALVAARSWHWRLLLTRSAHLLSHFNQRSATYTRPATRKLDGAAVAPTMPEPAWLAEPQAPAILDPVNL